MRHLAAALTSILLTLASCGTAPAEGEGQAGAVAAAAGAAAVAALDERPLTTAAGAAAVVALDERPLTTAAGAAAVATLDEGPVTTAIAATLPLPNFPTAAETLNLCHEDCKAQKLPPAAAAACVKRCDAPLAPDAKPDLTDKQLA